MFEILSFNFFENKRINLNNKRLITIPVAIIETGTFSFIKQILKTNLNSQFYLQ